MELPIIQSDTGCLPLQQSVWSDWSPFATDSGLPPPTLIPGPWPQQTAIPKSLIGSVPGICDGNPVILGTRITVSHIWEIFTRLGWSIVRICREYPGLTPAQVVDALKYAEQDPSLFIEEQD
jgi:uncharacterized protein (DUF433 family)